MTRSLVGVLAAASMSLLSAQLAEAKGCSTLDIFGRGQSAAICDLWEAKKNPGEGTCPQCIQIAGRAKGGGKGNNGEAEPPKEDGNGKGGNGKGGNGKGGNGKGGNGKGGNGKGGNGKGDNLDEDVEIDIDEDEEIDIDEDDLNEEVDNSIDFGDLPGGADDNNDVDFGDVDFGDDGFGDDGFGDDGFGDDGFGDDGFFGDDDFDPDEDGEFLEDLDDSQIDALLDGIFRQGGTVGRSNNALHSRYGSYGSGGSGSASGVAVSVVVVASSMAFAAL